MDYFIPVGLITSKFLFPFTFFTNYNYNVPPTPPNPVVNYCGESSPPTTCDVSPYRSIDGSCNNLQNPLYGMSQTTYSRLVYPPRYSKNPNTQKLDVPPLSVTGSELPSARTLRLEFFPDGNVTDRKYTLAAMQYGQLITHDMSFASGISGASCCDNDGNLSKDADDISVCYPIILDENDPVRINSSKTCLDLVRTKRDHENGCTSGNQASEQINGATHFLDLSIIYGSTIELSHKLREYKNGRLKVEFREDQQWPIRNEQKNVCEKDPNAEQPKVCYKSGDARINQNPQLTILHILWIREHNRIADILCKLNPEWDDETIFQETRKITIAQHQYISYNEWLPIFIGYKNSIKKGIIYESDKFINDYKHNVNPNVLNEHTTAAMRYFHSAIAGKLDLISSEIMYEKFIYLSEYVHKPKILEEDGNFDKLTQGLSTQNQQAVDLYHTEEITKIIRFGNDLKALDIQRGRDHGLASYNDIRSVCGRRKARKFSDFLDLIPIIYVKKLQKLYKNVNDVDFIVGASLEKHVHGTLAGPTFLCVLSEQFTRTRIGDRYWFEREDSFTGFSIDQLNSIRNTSLARLFCDNGKSIKFIQKRAFEIPTRHSFQPCEDIPRVDISLWKEKKEGFRTIQKKPNVDDILFGCDEDLI